MIARDRELLAHLQRFNAALGPAVVEMIHRQDGGELPADGLRNLAKQCRTLADELDTGAEERDVVESEPIGVCEIDKPCGTAPFSVIPCTCGGCTGSAGEQWIP